MDKKFTRDLISGLFAIAFIAGISPASAADLAKAQSGKILLQVEAKGEAWYVNPADNLRYFMGRPEDAFSLMRKLGVGISTANLKKIKAAAKNMAGPDADGDGLSDMFEDAIGTDKTKKDTDNDSFGDQQEFTGGYNPNGQGKLSGLDVNFSNTQKGKILLQVEGHGEAWYINPADGLRYFMGRPADAFGLMRALGLGINNANLAKIPVSAGAKAPAGSAAPSANNNQTATLDAALDPALAAIITAHQAKLAEFIATYDKYDKTAYEKLVAGLFVSTSQTTAKKITDEFFMDFVDSGLRSINDLDLNEEYVFAAEDAEAAKPYEKTDASTIIIGIGLDFILPYELKNENGWKIKLDLAKDYSAEIAKIDGISENAEASEMETYLAGKTKAALQEYKKTFGKYPKSLKQAAVKYSALKDYADDFSYAYQANAAKCHLGIDIDDEDAKLKSDSDKNSETLGFTNGFDGADPTYDFLLE